MGLENKEARLQLAKTVAAYKRAIKYLDTCGELTLEKLFEAKHIAGTGPDDQWLRTMWEQMQYTLPGVGEGPGGREQLRWEMRRTMVQAISSFEALIGTTTDHTQRWWQLWK
ncbi:MAG: hypothetical protein ABSG79_03755 [Bryobacteraceae bacterium]|jgi:hypothetical protein